MTRRLSTLACTAILSLTRLLSPPAAAEPPALPDDVRARVEAATVLIEMFDADGDLITHVSGFLAQPGWVITNWHCAEGASEAFVNLGERGVYRVTGILADDSVNDFVILTADLPPDAGPGLPLSPSRAAPGTPVWIAVRDRLGQLTLSPGEAREENSHFGVTLFESTAKGWPGCSGSPWIDQSGRVVAVVCGGGDWDEQRGQRISVGVPARLVRSARLYESRSLRDWWGLQIERRMPEVRAINRRAREAFAEGEYDKAAAEYRRALAIMPEYLLLRHYMASALEQSGKPDAAVATLLEYTDRFPATAAVWHHIGDIHYRAGKFIEARDAYREAIRLGPYADVYFWLGVVEERLGNGAEARAAFERALELEPDHTRARAGLLRSLAQNGETDRLAAALAEMAAAEHPDYDAIIGVAGRAVRAGHQSIAAAVADTLALRNAYIANRIRSMIRLHEEARSDAGLPDLIPDGSRLTPPGP